MTGGANGPATLNGAAFSYPTKTLKQIRIRMLKRMGYSAMLTTPPLGIETLLNDFIQGAHEQLYYRVPKLRRERWWNIETEASSRFYDIPYNGAYSGESKDFQFVSGSPDTIPRADGGDFTADGWLADMTLRIQGSNDNEGTVEVASVAATTITLSQNLTLTAENNNNLVTLSELNWTYLETLRVKEVWLEDADRWCQLKNGINPANFVLTNDGYPECYEIRNYIEIWPAPDDVYQIYIRGDEGLTPMEVDTDQSAVDPQAVFLFALANAKAHYGHQDARTYYSQLEVHLRKLNAGTFSPDKRYVPRRKEATAPPLPYPKVTFTRT